MVILFHDGISDAGQVQIEDRGFRDFQTRGYLNDYHTNCLKGWDR